jgi:hypothetical protein
MTTPIDPIERRLPEALTDLASPRTPDYFIDILGQTARIRQRPAWVRPGRWISMNGFLGRPAFAAAVVVLVVVIGGALFFSRSTGPATDGVVPSTAPTVVPTAPPSATTQIPAGLRYMWVGPKRTIASMPSSDRYRFRLTSVQLGFPNDQLQDDWFDSQASAIGPDQLSLSALSSSSGCQSGDVGRYAWSLSASGVRLHLTTVSDPCANRSSALAGNWIRVACTDTSDGCFGDLEAGTFPSQYVAPRVGPIDSWHPDLGAITYTIPDGWANSSDWPTIFSLSPTADYANWTSAGPPDGASYGIYVYTRPAATTQPSDCSDVEQTSVKQTASGLMDWVRSRPSLVATTPTPITIGGLSGVFADIKVAPSWTATCPDTSQPTSVFLTQAGNATDGWGDMGIIGAEQVRLILLDLGGGHTVAIAIDSTDPARFQALVDQAMPIVSSFTFK